MASPRTRTTAASRVTRPRRCPNGARVRRSPPNRQQLRVRRQRRQRCSNTTIAAATATAATATAATATVCKICLKIIVETSSTLVD